jgi:hypothetical protein
MDFLEYVVVGCDDTYPGRRGGVARVLGIGWNAALVSERIVLAPDYPVHRGRFFGMKTQRGAPSFSDSSPTRTRLV